MVTENVIKQIKLYTFGFYFLLDVSNVVFCIELANVFITWDNVITGDGI